MTLLTKALAITPERKNGNENVNDEVLELAMAYTRHEITQKQVAKVMGIKESATQAAMRGALASAVRAGKLVFVK